MRPRINATTALLASALVPALAGAGPEPAAFDPSHAAWSALLAEHVEGGEVDYAGLVEERARLDRYLQSVEALAPAAYERLGRDDQLAFWINVYNAYTVKLVLDHYPVESIKDIGPFLLGPFRKRFIPLERLRGATLSLNDVEHEILRKDFREPRIHFAIVCASRSCPALAAEAYTGARLDAQLTRAARDFLADPDKNRIDPATGRVQLSAVFKWFREDFEAAAGSLASFVAGYAPDAMAAALEAEEPAPVEFLEYDWSLNGK